MDEQSTHGEDDLGLDSDTDTDDVADTAASDTDEQETDSEDEQEQDTLELKDVEETPKDKGKAEAARQAEAWAKKIKSGDKTLDDLPANLQWLKADVEAKLGKKELGLSELVQREIATQRETDRFENLKDDLEDYGLTKQQKSDLQEKFKNFRGKGLTKLDALETAMETLSINPSEKALEARRQAMRLRTPGSYRKGNNVSPDELHKEGYAAVAEGTTPEKRIEYLKRIRQGL